MLSACVSVWVRVYGMGVSVGLHLERWRVDRTWYDTDVLEGLG